MPTAIRATVAEPDPELLVIPSITRIATPPRAEGKWGDLIEVREPSEVPDETENPEDDQRDRGGGIAGSIIPIVIAVRDVELRGGSLTVDC